MQINKNELVQALEIVKPGLASKEIIEQATSFAFIDDRVVTYNDEISISHPIEGLNLTGAIESDQLYKFLNKIKKDEIEFTIENNQIILTTGRAKAGLTLHAEVTLPLDKELSDKGKWKSLPTDFSKFLAFAMTSCSRDMSKPILTCVHVSKHGIIESSDNYRITQCHLESEMPLDDFLIPATSAAEVVKINPVKIAEGTGWMHFQNEIGTVLSCRVINEAFPNITPHLKVDGIRLILPNSTSEVLDRAMVFSKRDHSLDETVFVSIQDRRLQIRSESSCGWFEEDINMKYSGDPVLFAITPSLLKGILSETSECEINADTHKLKFAGERWIHLTMLKIIKEKK